MSIGDMMEGITGDIISLKDIKWMIFKVKQKGSSNYDKKMSDDLNDERFKFDQQNVDESISGLKYGYNWPYDFFSMVENVKVSVEVNLNKTEVLDSESTSSFISDESIAPGYEQGIPLAEESTTFSVVDFGETQDSDKPVKVVSKTVVQTANVLDNLLPDDE